jgi:hypothetical protein
MTLHRPFSRVPATRTPRSTLLLVLLVALLAVPALLRPAPPAYAAPLTAGDIAVIGFNISGDPQQFTIVTLADIDGGEVIKITDAGWTGSGFMSNTSEGTITWTTPGGGIPAGTVIQFSIGKGNNNVSMSPSLGSISVTGWTSTSTFGSPFSGAGDQILIYQGTSDFIYGFTNTNDGSISAPGEWSNTVGTFTQQSLLPPGLVNSTGSNVATAHALTGMGFSNQGPLHEDNNVYIGLTTGTKDDLLTAIGTDSNWTGDDSTPQDIAPGGTQFTGSNPIFTVSTNAPPTADAGGPYTVNEGGTVVLAGSGTDSDGTIATYEWDLDGDGNFGETGAAATRGNETGQTPTFNAAGLNGPASFPISLRVTDDGGATDTDTSVSISITNVAPTADAGGPYTVNEGGTVALAGSGSDPVDGLTYAWDLDNDGTFGETGAAATRGDETGQTPTFSAAGLNGPGSVSLV